MTLQSFQKYSIIHNIDISLDVFEANMNIWSKVSNEYVDVPFSISACQCPFTRVGTCADEKVRERERERERHLTHHLWHRCPRDNYAIPAGSFKFMLRGRGSNQNKVSCIVPMSHPAGVSTTAFYRVRIRLVSR